MEDLFKVTGNLDIVLTGPDGKIKEQIHVPNLVVTVGKNFIASRMVGTTSAVMSHMAVGTNSTTPAAANTVLVAEVARVVLTSGTSALNVASYSATFGPGIGTGALTEAGIFNASSAGTMLCRTTFDVINKGSADSLAINWNVTVN